MLNFVYQRSVLMFLPHVIVALLLYGLTTQMAYLGYLALYRTNSQEVSCFSSRTLFFLTVFQVLPFVQLETSFLGELIVKLLISPHWTHIELIFCSIYPFLMGSI